MIFYFSGTGNTRYIATLVSNGLNDELIEINSTLTSSDMEFTLSEGESIGIISPVYWYGLPMEVITFANKLTLINYSNNYIYTIATYGGSAGKFAEQLEKILLVKSYKLNSKLGVKMSDNYIIGYNPPSKEEQIRYNNEAVKKVKTFIPRIKAHESIEDINRGAMRFVTPMIRPLYEKADRSKKFYVTNACTSCGLCMRNCPCDSVHMVNGKPEWNNKCSQCLRCINYCPTRAIQYGKATIKRERYVFDESVIKE